jgi:hypothetical protein
LTKKQDWLDGEIQPKTPPMKQVLDLDAVAGFAEQLFQPGLAGMERLLPDIIAADRQQIEGD